jgi:Lipopolysaccharide-assembly
LKNNRLKSICALFLSLSMGLSGCGIYSMTGAATSAKTISVDQFYNNTDLAPANVAQDFTNTVKDYYQQNSSLRVISEGGELQLEGVITNYQLSPIAPVANASSPSSGSVVPSAQATSTAALSRLSISVKVTYVDNTEPKNSFKDKTFSFYADFDNATNPNFSAIQDDLQKKIFAQILIDMFNATVANW